MGRGKYSTVFHIPFDCIADLSGRQAKYSLGQLFDCLKIKILFPTNFYWVVYLSNDPINNAVTLEHPPISISISISISVSIRGYANFRYLYYLHNCLLNFPSRLPPPLPHLSLRHQLSLCQQSNQLSIESFRLLEFYSPARYSLHLRPISPIVLNKLEKSQWKAH